MKITYKVKNISLSQDLEELFCQIDFKIAKLSKQKLDSIRYDIQGSTCIKQVSYNTILLLVRYKDILLDKTYGHPCLCDYDLEDIMSRIKRILSTN